MRGSSPVRGCGVCGSENAGMSSDLEGENPSRRLTKGSRGRLFRSGLVGA